MVESCLEHLVLQVMRQRHEPAALRPAQPPVLRRNRVVQLLQRRAHPRRLLAILLADRGPEVPQILCRELECALELAGVLLLGRCPRPRLRRRRQAQARGARGFLPPKRLLAAEARLSLGARGFVALFSAASAHHRFARLYLTPSLIR